MNLAYVSVIGIFHAPNGTTIGAQQEYAFVNILTPDQKSPFDMNSTLLNSMVGNYTIHVATALATALKPFAGLKISGNSSGILPSGNYYVDGQVENLGNSTAQNLEIVGTFYNSAGKILAADIVPLTPSFLGPGQNESFNMTVSTNVNQIGSSKSPNPTDNCRCL